MTLSFLFVKGEKKMYREAIKLDAKGKREAFVALARALGGVLSSRNGSRITFRMLKPDKNGRITDSEAMKYFKDAGVRVATQMSKSKRRGLL